MSTSVSLREGELNGKRIRRTGERSNHLKDWNVGTDGRRDGEGCRGEGV